MFSPDNPIFPTNKRYPRYSCNFV